MSHHPARRPELSARLHQLARRYVALHERAASALGGGAGAAASPVLGAQLAAFARLQTRFGQLAHEQQSVAAALELRQRQARRLEDEIGTRERQLARLHEMLEIRQAWVLQRQQSEWLRDEVLRRMRQQVAQLRRDRYREDDEINLLRRTRGLLASSADVLRAGGVDQLAENLTAIHSLIDRVEQNERELSASPRRAAQANHLAFGDGPHPERRARGALDQARGQAARARGALAEAALAAAAVDAELNALQVVLAWHRGELAAERQWQDIEHELARRSSSREQQLRAARDEAGRVLAEAHGELAGREAQLSWISGEIVGRRLFAHLAFAAEAE